MKTAIRVALFLTIAILLVVSLLFPLMHTIIDPLVVVANESVYAELITAAGREDQLFQTYTNGNGHCNFTGTQFLTAVGAIDVWVRTGVKPTNAFFPAALGFQQTFVPPPMLQP
ncbi:MAG TPA: hypothetical protein VMZ30_01575 [Pyrinomonadaceae bacterium]|nr:hypothetical protein [Pyrinomonadaceae bacterium]